MAALGSLFLGVLGMPNLKAISSVNHSVIDESAPEIKRDQLLTQIRIWLLVGMFVLQAFFKVFEMTFA